MACPGVFSILRASSPWLEPGDLPCLGEAVSLNGQFLRLKSASKQTVLTQTPHSPSQRVVGRSPMLRCGPTPTANAAPCLLVPSGHRQGSFVACFTLSATRRHARPERRLTLPVVQSCIVGRRTGLANALAVGVFDADTCGRRFLLDLSVALQDKSNADGFMF